MIVYNVDRKFFALKSRAVAYRKELSLGKDALITLRVENRDDLAALLNGLCAIERNPAEHWQGGIAPPMVAAIPACVPDFLKKEWGY